MRNPTPGRTTAALCTQQWSHAASVKDMTDRPAATGGPEPSAIPSERAFMVIALLAVLGVDLIVLVAFLGVVVGRRRWVSR